MEQATFLSEEEIGQMKIAYRSDFKLTMESDAGWHLPFEINFWSAGAPARRYTAGYDGENWTNCRIDNINDQKLIVAFDDHKLGIGQLMCEIHYTLVDPDFPTTFDDEILQPMAVISTDEHGRKNYVVLNLEGETAVDIIFVLPLIAQEQYRINNENERIAQERIRQQNELNRQENERQRVEAESQREIDFKNAQKAHQDAYEASEEERNSTFSNNEVQRQHTFDTNEAERQRNETERIEKENERQVAETSRVNAEDLRVSAEEARDASFRAWGLSILNGQLCQTYNK